MKDGEADRGGEDGGENWLAAEYALGVLPAPDRLRAERLARQNLSFAAEVEGWERRLAPLGEAIRPQTPPAALWAAIERELPAPRPVPRPIPQPTAGARVERLVAPVWRWFALGSTGLLAASLAAITLLVTAPAPMPAMMASVASADGASLVTAVFDPANGHAMLMPADMTMPEGRVPELWLIPDGKPPISLGLLQPGRSLRIELPRSDMSEGMMKRGGVTLAISAEPEGGSPTGQPTGPVMGTGALRSV
ncbi:hypothetical protein NS226_19790 [Aureimonas ureilytica]|uniref:Anti-sigma K factor RskA C-terminal domain-containing protein n=1 Tax=Aureimonas ureilytica TaxID=401562 RepID=A0A175R5L3_9HYPH|nr:anti-sigma factor [Aureimonas ureilytica]KTQ85364.1 hypothetical protein NS226_19790 [Aureimonas ureilytica]